MVFSCGRPEACLRQASGKLRLAPSKLCLTPNNQGTVWGIKGVVMLRYVVEWDTMRHRRHIPHSYAMSLAAGVS